MRVSFNKEIFKNSENGYCVFSYTASTRDIPEFARKYSYAYEQEFTAVGYFLPNNKKVEYELEGTWKKDKYGYSFAVSSHEDIVPENKSGLIAYLSSGLIKGVGEKTAKLIVDNFGLRTLEVMENSPEDLLEIKGISKRKLNKIIESYQSTKAIKSLVAFLKPYGVSTNAIMKIYKRFGPSSTHVIEDNPFLLCDIDGFGFKTVDEIADSLSYPPNGKERIECAVLYSLDKAKRDGHLYLNQKDLLDSAFGLLNARIDRTEVVREEISKAIVSLQKNDEVMVDGDDVYKAGCFRAEVSGAFNVKRLLQEKGQQYFVTDKDIENLEDYFCMSFAEKQKEALAMCMKNNVSIITGGPGTGKSTILKAILKMYKILLGENIVLLAPTGKAARRMEECTGMPASTIHSALLIHSDNEDDDCGSAPLDAAFVVVDEFSMVDMALAKNLLSKIKTGAKLLLIGDPDQLPSVGAGNVFRELINSNEIPTTVLDVVYRQSEVSKIVANAVKINTGKLSLDYDETFTLTQISDETKAADEIVKKYVEEVRKVGIENVQVLTPLRKRGDACSDSLNQKIQAVLNPAIAMKKEVVIGHKHFRIGDRIMQIKNNEHASNGETGEIIDIHVDEDDDYRHAIVW